MSGIRGEQAKRCMLTGKAGEYAVASQLVLRNVHVYFPASDYGVDLLCDNGCRIQVKTAHMSNTPKMVSQHGNGCYVFPLKKTKRVAVTNNRCVLRTMPKFSDTSDVLVFWGVEQNRFWIVPSKLCNLVHVLVLGRDNPPRFIGTVDELRSMSSGGYSHEAIALKYGVSRTVITRLLNQDGFTSQNQSVVGLARECENAWEYILDFVRPATAVISEFPSSEKIGA